MGLDLLNENLAFVGVNIQRLISKNLYINHNPLPSFLTPCTIRTFALFQLPVTRQDLDTPKEKLRNKIIVAPLSNAMVS